MTAMMRLAATLLGLTFMLPGCTALSALGSASQPLDIYELRTPPAQTVAARRRGIELVVEEPIASGALATERIMIRPSPLQAQYLPDVRWSDTAPVMLQTLVVRSLAETGALGSVGRRPIGAVADFAVLGELTDFQAETDAEGDGASVRIRLDLRIVRERDARVVATRSFQTVEPVSATDSDSIVAGFDRASAALLTELVPWILSRAVY